MTAVKKTTIETPGSAIRHRAETAAGWAAVLLTFLLPLKFGGVAVIPEMPGYFPPEGWMYLLTDWSSNVWAILAGIALLLVLMTEKEFKLNFFTGAGVLLFLATLPGWLAPTGIRDYCWSTSLHAAATGAWWCAAGFLVNRAPVWRDRLLAAAAAGCLVTGVIALRQYFFGFEEMRVFADEQKAQGIAINDAVMAQIYDTRVRATFANNNMLAGFLLLVSPLAVLLMTRWGSRFTPEKLSKSLFGAIALLCTVLPFFLTRSRGALAAAGAALLLAGWLLPLKRSRKWALAAVTIVVLIGGGIVFQKGRGTLTLQSRLDYWRTSAQLTAEKPLAGFGWGGFYLEHTRRKLLRSQETAHDPHNVAAAFAAQSGLPAALVALAILLWPLVMLWKKRQNFDALKIALFCGALALFLHLMVDVGWEDSALLALYGTLLAAVLPYPKSDAAVPAWQKWGTGAGLTVFALVTLTGGIVMLKGETALARLHERLYPESSTAMRQPPTAWEVELLAKDFARCRPWSAAGEETAGDFLLATGELELAETHFRRAAQLVPPHYSLEHRFFDLAMKRGDLTAAGRHRAKMLELFPTTLQLPPDPAVRPADPLPASALPATPSK